MKFAASELILNADGSVYHLNLLPEDIATTVILVGDPERVTKVSEYFDEIELKKGKREFITHTGWLNSKRISVVSTGIGTDNIDIVLNELDALVNIDLVHRTTKSSLTALELIRIGTSGAIQENIPVDSFLLSEYGIGLDGLLHYYDFTGANQALFQKALAKHLDWGGKAIAPYVFKCDGSLQKKLMSNRIRLGATVTNAGFYAPQGRTLRLQNSLLNFHERLTSFSFENKQLTNLEMETSAIYGLSKLLGHKAVSMNAILANRTTGKFTKDGLKTMNELIQYCLRALTS